MIATAGDRHKPRPNTTLSRTSRWAWLLATGLAASITAAWRAMRCRGLPHRRQRACNPRWRRHLDASAATRRADGRFRLRAVQALLENANHLHQPVLGSNDVGKDAYVDIVVDGDVSGDVIALQIKRGRVLPPSPRLRDPLHRRGPRALAFKLDPGVRRRARRRQAALDEPHRLGAGASQASDMRPAAAPGDATLCSRRAAPARILGPGARLPARRRPPAMRARCACCELLCGTCAIGPRSLPRFRC